MRTVAGVLILSLCFTPAAVDLRLESPQSAGQVDAQKQAWNILVGGAHGSNMDKRANAVQALGRKINSSDTLCIYTGIRSIDASVIRSLPICPWLITP